MEKAFFKRISSVIFSSDKTELDICQKIYYKCLLASRRPEFYTKFEVADTFDGRFDMLCLIISVYMHKLTKEPEKTKSSFAPMNFSSLIRTPPTSYSQIILSGLHIIRVGAGLRKTSPSRITLP